VDEQIACGHDLPIKNKGELYETIRSAILYCSLYCPLKCKPNKSVVDMRMLRWISELPRKY